MAQYRQVKRNGRWVTINTKTGKEVGVGEGTLGDIAKRVGNELSYAGKNLVYSDKTDDKGRPLTIAQANQTSKPKPKVAVKPPVKPKPETKPTVKPKVEAKPTPTKPKPAEVQPAKPTVRASEQKPTVQKPAVKQSSDMDKNYEAWAKSNRKLAEKVKPGQAGYDAIQKALGKSSSTNGDMKIKPENKTNTAAQRTQEAAEATKPTSKVKPQEFNTRNVFETAEQRRRRLAMEKLAK